NCGNVLWLADEVECAQRFPDLLGGRVDGRNEISLPDLLANLSRERAQTAGDWGTNFSRVTRADVSANVPAAVPANLELRNDSTLVNAGADTAGVRDLSGIGRKHLCRLQKFNDLGPSGCVSEADQGKRGVAPHRKRRVGEHFQQSFMQASAGCVLPHHPGIGVAYLFHRI